VSAPGSVSQHGAHLGMLLGPVLLLALWAGWSDLRSWLHRHDDLATPLLVAAALSAGAGVIHALVIPSHVLEDPLYGAFFAALTVVQLGWAAAAINRPTAWVLRCGAAVNLGVVGLWTTTRAVGIPLGVASGRREAVGSLDVTCSLLELGVVGCCAVLLRARSPAAASVG
jgi:hypothetical protein